MEPGQVPCSESDRKQVVKMITKAKRRHSKKERKNKELNQVKQEVLIEAMPSIIVDSGAMSNCK